MNYDLPRRSSWTREQIRFLYERGPHLTSKEIASQLDKKEETVKSMMRRLGVDWKRIRRTENRDAEIQALWTANTPTQIAERLSIPRGDVYSAAKRLGLAIKTPDRPPEMYRKAQAASSQVQRENSRARAEEKFGNWSPVSAYVFGVLWADGYVVDCGVGLTVQKKDHEWHEKIGRWFDPDIRITNGRVHLQGKTYETVTWVWGCVEGRKLLERMGMMRRKSFVDPAYPMVPDNVFSHFARGFQDGDGSPTPTALRWYGSPRFMEGFREQAIRVWSPVSPNRLLSHGKLRLLQWGARRDTRLIRERLYEGAEDWYLPRKKKDCDSTLQRSESDQSDWASSIELSQSWRHQTDGANSDA